LARLRRAGWPRRGAVACARENQSYWHFQNHTAGPGVHGNPFGGYNYAKLSLAGGRSARRRRTALIEVNGALLDAPLQRDTPS
jgi:hypothetical protein